MLRWQGNTLFSLLVACQCIYMIVCVAHFRISERTKCKSSKNIIKYVVKVSINECVQECRARQRCAFLNYRRRTLLCELYTDDDGASDVFITNSISTGPCVFVHRVDIQNSSNTSDCACQNEEICVPADGTCVSKECPGFEVPNAIIEGNMKDIGARVKVTCVEDPSTTTIQCLSNGTWDYEPSCPSRYLGCYRDDGARILMPHLQINNNEMTNDHCMEHCTGYNYAATQYTSYCFCGNALDENLKRPEADCAMPCSGNPSEICGGPWRGSVYRVN